ncbi:unnamed protein product, partial [Heterosigma akashiwo]
EGREVKRGPGRPGRPPGRGGKRLGRPPGSTNRDSALRRIERDSGAKRGPGRISAAGAGTVSGDPAWVRRQQPWAARGRKPKVVVGREVRGMQFAIALMEGTAKETGSHDKAYTRTQI